MDCKTGCLAAITLLYVAKDLPTKIGGQSFPNNDQPCMPIFVRQEKTSFEHLDWVKIEEPFLREHVPEKNNDPYIPQWGLMNCIF